MRRPSLSGVVCAVASTVIAVAGGAVGCARPFLANDGTVVFSPGGTHGAAVVTANGVEFHDRADVPERVISRSPDEPWRAPIGFILPQGGRFTETSRPTVLTAPGLAVVLRPSDTRVPSWGGEVLVRIDVVAPAPEGTARAGANVAIVLDGHGDDTLALADVALAQLAGRDRVVVVDARDARLVAPMVPGAHRSLVHAAIDRRLAEPRSTLTAAGASDLPHALRRAADEVGATGDRRIVVLSDGEGTRAAGDDAVRDAMASVEPLGIAVQFVETQGDAASSASEAAAAASLAERGGIVRDAVPAAGPIALRDVRLTFAGTPAPSHVLEASGGDVAWGLDSGELALGDVHAGEQRTEVVRVTVPAWVPGERFSFAVTARWTEAAGGAPREFVAALPCVYDDDIERIAESRHGDVLAYASALATLKRLDAAFVGDGVARAGGLRRIAELHARSMALLARDTHDAAIAEQAALLEGILEATR